MAKKITLWAAVILWMTVIFAFSAQPAVQSDELSMGLAEKILQFIEMIRAIPAFSGIDGTALAGVIAAANYYVRKTAHFTAYAILGVLLYNLMASYGMKRGKAVLLSAVVCLVYAITDEVHQLFVPGRAGQIRDVLIDFSGSLSALGVTYLLFGRRVRKEG